ncbi:glyoxylate/hydroxypyruvate reductase A [Crenobacter sp. SG2305]|uniref:2-hydroxyacid dehydrogenase n=1 Tax=Crenobacter oryzisoli TaxID=3056844 RepID=UPI0025AA7746|nr:glyoxylate/hydroxypyruvate reductase A [Crenobacter sp. SG2305]MDN0081730.1 glyoxylate/hydroxypyruvate reductase A [Crenobacter sp. SG2305]
MLYLYTASDAERWSDAFRRLLPDFDVIAWPAPVDPAQVRYIVTWNPPEGFFDGFPKLEAVFAQGAGIDKLLARPDLAPNVRVVRLTDAGMSAQMVEYALFGVLRFQRDFDVYATQQANSTWQPQPPRLAEATRVSVLGLGAIGAAVASTLAGLGYRVSGWSRSPRELPGVRCVYGPTALDALLADTDILVSVLPSTPDTRGLLGRERLALLPDGAALINAGRGDLIDLSALVELLDAGHLRGAQLDVFPAEPLGTDDPLWRHPKLLVTPHIAAATLIEPSVKQMADGIRLLQVGGEPAGLVERRHAY